MTIALCEKRRGILQAGAHLLVLGGPGAGKTTIALFKAKLRAETMSPGQEVLFLSFSRAAVRQILLRCASLLTTDERRRIHVQTYHSFCLEVLEAHGRLLSGAPPRFLYPSDERLQKSAFDGDWVGERQRLAQDQATYCFDLFADAVASLFERSAAVRSLYAEKHPLVIVDEFQDTDNDQWRMVRALAGTTTVFCLADPEQRIFDYRGDIDPRRLEVLRETLAPAEFDLAGDNHRSPASAILSFADSVLRNRAPLPETADVKVVRYYRHTDMPATVHAHVLWMFSRLRSSGIADPSVAVLARNNLLVAQLSGILSEPHTYQRQEMPPIVHDVVWDAELTAAAATVIGSILEWLGKPGPCAVAETLRFAANYYHLKNAKRPSQTALTEARKLLKEAAQVTRGAAPKTKTAKAMVAAHATGLDLTGDPVEDWKRARRVLQGISGLNDIVGDARLVRLFRATDALAEALGDLWVSTSSYAGAAPLVKRILDQEKLVSAERESEGCILMTMHKSKGKEFDGVVLVEGYFGASFFNDRESPPHEASRRLLRVGITRARKFVTIVRPIGALPLVG